MQLCLVPSDGSSRFQATGSQIGSQIWGPFRSIDGTLSGMGKLLTQARVDSAKLSAGKKEELISDFGGLYLRLRPKAGGETAKSWVFRYTAADGSRSKMALPEEVDGQAVGLDLELARRAAQQAREQLAKGIDPLAHKEATVAKKLAEQVAKKHSNDPKTVEELGALWLEKYAKRKHKDGGADAGALFKNHINPRLGSIRLSDLKTTHISGMLDDIYEAGKKRTCGVVLLKLKQALDWAVDREYVLRNVAKNLDPSHWEGVARKRKRYLTFPEIQQLVHLLEHSTLNPRWKHAVWLLMATGPRVAEAMNAELSHIDMKARTWTIPAENLKEVQTEEERQDQVIFLSDFASAHMRILMNMAGARFLFPARGTAHTQNEHPCSEQTLTHAVTDRQVEPDSEEAKKPKQGRPLSNELVLPGGRWTSHDLRRTMATSMGELGVDRDVISMCQAQLVGTDVQRSYQHQQLLGAKKAAWHTWGDKLASLVDEALQDHEANEAAKLAAQERLKKRNDKRASLMRQAISKRVAAKKVAVKKAAEEDTFKALDALAQSILTPAAGASSDGEDI